ncbi:hypothetical protein PR048_030212 [Dryococelus australis]|uniref:Uncharacterized protein n=1 Tax=Dryococelus australis TaxID=614101 RepID=A0ABQ9G8B1_9NEOP|nr:hypothetical protein PR048_030212 [Dryococelus australis]
MASAFRVFIKPLCVEPTTAGLRYVGVRVLAQFLRRNKETRERYSPPGFENTDVGEVIQGTWRQIVAHDTGTEVATRRGNSTSDARGIPLATGCASVLAQLAFTLKNAHASAHEACLVTHGKRHRGNQALTILLLLRRRPSPTIATHSAPTRCGGICFILIGYSSSQRIAYVRVADISTFIASYFSYSYATPLPDGSCINTGNYPMKGRVGVATQQACRVSCQKPNAAARRSEERLGLASIFHGRLQWMVGMLFTTDGMTTDILEARMYIYLADATVPSGNPCKQALSNLQRELSAIANKIMDSRHPCRTEPLILIGGVRNPLTNSGATVAERLGCSPPTTAIRVQPRPGHSGFSHVGVVPDDAVGRRFFFIGDLPFPTPLHSGAAPLSPESPSSALKTSMLRAVQISSLTHSINKALHVSVLESAIKLQQHIGILVCKMEDKGASPFLQVPATINQAALPPTRGGKCPPSPSSHCNTYARAGATTLAFSPPPRSRTARVCFSSGPCSPHISPTAILCVRSWKLQLTLRFRNLLRKMDVQPAEFSCSVIVIETYDWAQKVSDKRGIMYELQGPREPIPVLAKVKFLLLLEHEEEHLFRHSVSKIQSPSSFCLELVRECNFEHGKSFPLQRVLLRCYWYSRKVDVVSVAVDVGVVVQRQRRQRGRRGRLMCPRVLLEVVLAAETLAARGAGVGPQPRVDPLVASQLLVPRERLAALRRVALERPLACHTSPYNTNVSIAANITTTTTIIPSTSSSYHHYYHNNHHRHHHHHHHHHYHHINIIIQPLPQSYHYYYHRRHHRHHHHHHHYQHHHQHRHIHHHHHITITTITIMSPLPPFRISIQDGARVAERLARSSPTKANRAQSPAGSPDFRKWESCRTMPLVGGFSWGSPVSPTPLFRRRSIFTAITPIGS